jgi:hypothetical protein
MRDTKLVTGLNLLAEFDVALILFTHDGTLGWARNRSRSIHVTTLPAAADIRPRHADGWV